MKKIKLFLIDFMLYMYTRHIKEDWDDINTFGLIILTPVWFINSCIIWIVSPLFIPLYFIHNSITLQQTKNRIQNKKTFNQYTKSIKL